MKRKIMENKITAIKILAAALIVVFLVSYIPRNINVEYPAIRYPESGSDVVQTSVVIKGKLSRPLFSSPTFKGTIIIEDYNFTKEDRLLSLKFGKDFEESNDLVYESYDANTGYLDMKGVGYIWILGNMDKICIWGAAPENVGATGDFEEVIISAPAETKEDAVQIADQLLPESVNSKFSGESMSLEME